MDTISIHGAKTHNLKNISLDIPRDKLVIVTGLSGSGKSSLAFDTLYAEGQRRYVESLSAYARQFLSLMEKPDIEHIEGLSPAISIEQKSTSHNPRSTVGTITEIYDYLRLLFARVGEPHCPTHGIKLQSQSISQMVDQVMGLSEDTRVNLLAPVIRERKGEHLHLFKQLASQGFVRARIDGIITDLDTTPDLDKNKKHTIEVVIDRFRIRPDLMTRLADSFETAVQVADGIAAISFPDDKTEDLLFSSRFACPQCGHSIQELEPRFFSFNNPAGACQDCDGSACASILIRTQWYRTGSCLWQKAQSTAGTGGISIISKCLDQFQNTMVSSLRHHSRSFRTSTKKSFFAEVVPKRFSFGTSTIAETNIAVATSSKGSSLIWSAATVKPIPRW